MVVIRAVMLKSFFNKGKSNEWVVWRSRNDDSSASACKVEVESG